MVVTAALEQIASPELTGCSDELARVNVGKLGDLIDTLKRGRVDRAIMVGKVSKSLIYKSVTVPDLRAMKLLFSSRTGRRRHSAWPLPLNLTKRAYTSLTRPPSAPTSRRRTAS
ncbi:MAG: hypothetical protein MZV70_59460 [Desulfobacterales bacterium]|nr:hypothetical protein [Desulfobacterales bacterium]